MTAPATERSYGVPIAATAILTLYFLFPYVFVIPIDLGIRRHILPPETLDRCIFVFAPIRFLTQHVAFYGSALDTEGSMLVRMGVLKHK